METQHISFEANAAQSNSTQGSITDNQITPNHPLSHTELEQSWHQKLLLIISNGSIKDLEIFNSSENLSAYAADRDAIANLKEIYSKLRSQEQPFIDYFYTNIFAKLAMEILNISENEKKNSLLKYAILLKQPDDIIINLINNINEIDTDKFYNKIISHIRPLVYEKRAKIIKILFEKVMHKAVQRNTPVLNLFVKESVNPYLIDSAIRNRDHDTLKLLLDHGASCKLSEETMPRRLESPLVQAVRTSDEEIVRLLLDYKANANSKTHDLSQTALHVAASLGNSKIIQLLLESGAEINIDKVSMQSKTPLLIAVENNQVLAVKVLLESGANVNIPDKENKIPLYVAVQINSLEIVNLLLEQKANNINTQDWALNSSLHLAVKHGNIEIVKVLLEHGAMIDIKDSENKTPLQLAVLNSKPEIVKILLEHGAMIDVADYENLKPLDIANKHANVEIANLIYIRSLKDYIKALNQVPDNYKKGFFSYTAAEEKKAAEALRSVVCDHVDPRILEPFAKYFKRGSLQKLFSSLLPLIKEIEAKCDYSIFETSDRAQELLEIEPYKI